MLGRPVDLVTEKALRPELRPFIEREAVHLRHLLLVSEVLRFLPRCVRLGRTRLAELRAHMNPFQALRNVLANLSEGAPPDAVRPEASGVPSPEFLVRLEALRRTEAFVATLADRVPAGLRGALEESVRHVDAPIVDLPALAAHLAGCRQGLAVAIDRGGAPAPSESKRLEDLERLAAWAAGLSVAAGSREHP